MAVVCAEERMEGDAQKHTNDLQTSPLRPMRRSESTIASNPHLNRGCQKTQQLSERLSRRPGQLHYKYHTAAGQTHRERSQKPSALKPRQSDTRRIWPRRRKQRRILPNFILILIYKYFVGLTTDLGECDAAALCHWLLTSHRPGFVRNPQSFMLPHYQM